jgi:hypothetical protein
MKNGIFELGWTASNFGDANHYLWRYCNFGLCANNLQHGNYYFPGDGQGFQEREMKKFNPSIVIYLLIALAAIAQGVMWTGVFALIHPGVLSYVGGIPAGLAIVGLVVYSANALPRVQSKRARISGWIMLILVIMAEPVVLGVVNWWSMPADFRALSASRVVAGGASLVISLVLVMSALVNRSLVKLDEPASKPHKPKAKPTVAEPEPAKASFVCKVAGCQAKPFGSQSALNAHQRKHKKIVGYVASFEPVTQKEIKP